MNNIYDEIISVSLISNMVLMDLQAFQYTTVAGSCSAS